MAIKISMEEKSNSRFELLTASLLSPVLAGGRDGGTFLDIFDNEPRPL